MKIKSAEYIKSFPDIKGIDLPDLPSIAFIGRSNVGKSSLINSLLNRKNLVKTSSNPGKTQLINFFLINELFYFVDLPGYGFANVPVRIKKQWEDMIYNFLSSYQNLKLIVQLVDIRRTPTKLDIHLNNIIKGLGADSLVIANKVDKLKKNEIQKAVKGVKTNLQISDQLILHSAPKKVGKDEIWKVLEQYLDVPE